MKRVILRVAWWFDDICRRVIRWATPDPDEAVRQAVARIGRRYDEP